MSEQEATPKNTRGTRRGTQAVAGVAGAAACLAIGPVFALAGIRLGAPSLPPRASRSGSAVLAAERRPVREPRPDLPPDVGLG
jgi:hypothetical protein